MKNVFLLSLLPLAITACSTTLPTTPSPSSTSLLNSQLSKYSNDGKLAYVLESGNTANKVSKLVVSAPNGQHSQMVFQTEGSIYSPAWSADGKSLAFSVQRPKALAVIYLLNLDNPSPVLLTPLKTNNLSPSFSPDGQSMLFSNSLDGDSDIYRLNFANTDDNENQLEKIIDLPSTEVQPSYAPNGNSFVFVSDTVTAGKPQLYRYNFSTGQTTRLSNNRYSASPSFSPTGDKIAFLNGQQASIMDLATMNITNIANTGLDEAPKFSPDGSCVVYASSSGVNGNSNGQINIQNLATGQVSSFITNGKARSPVWSR